MKAQKVSLTLESHVVSIFGHEAKYFNSRQDHTACVCHCTTTLMGSVCDDEKLRTKNDRSGYF